MHRFILLLCCLVSAACTRSRGTLAELKEYINDPDNGLSKSSLANGTEVKVTYLPTDVWVHRELEGEQYSKADIDSLRTLYSSRMYFSVSLANAGKEALQAGGSFSETLETMSFRMSDYVLLKANGHEVKPADYVLNRTYGFGSSTDMLFVFDRDNLTGSPIEFELREFGLKTGQQQFTFELGDMQSSPEIAFL